NPACCVELVNGLVEVDADPAELVDRVRVEALHLPDGDLAGQQHGPGVVRQGQVRFLRRLPYPEILGGAHAAAERFAAVVAGPFGRPSHAALHTPALRAAGAAHTGSAEGGLPPSQQTPDPNEGRRSGPAALRWQDEKFLAGKNRRVFVAQKHILLPVAFLHFPYFHNTTLGCGRLLKTTCGACACRRIYSRIHGAFDALGGVVAGRTEAVVRWVLAELRWVFGGLPINIVGIVGGGVLGLIVFVLPLAWGIEAAAVLLGYRAEV